MDGEEKGRVGIGLIGLGFADLLEDEDPDAEVFALLTRLGVRGREGRS